jgi:hypothetical protein
VYPVEFHGRAIGDTPMRDFGLDHADHLLAQSKCDTSRSS